MKWLALLDHYATFGQAPDPRARKVLERLLAGRTPWIGSDFSKAINRGDSVEKAFEFLADFFMRLYRIDMARVRPNDLLNDDLGFPKCLWSDWELDFAEEFRSKYGIDLFRTKAFLKAESVADLILVLSEELDNAATTR